MELTFNLTDKDGNPAAQAMANIIEKRTKELGETSVNVCKAIAINVLKSIRTDTKIANENLMDIQLKNVDSQYEVSWQVQSGAKGKNVRNRVLRQGGHVIIQHTLKDKNTKQKIDEKRVIWNCPKYCHGESIHVYQVTDKIAEQKTLQYLIVAQDEMTAIKTVESIHKKRVHRHKGFARYVLGQAMHEISDREKSDVTLNEGKQLADDKYDVTVSDNGFNSGDAFVHAIDNVGYATQALKHGETYVETALQKALNKMTAFINHKMHQKGIYDDMSIPFPELTKKSE